MKREDRVARLEALLARVRANVAARGDRPRSLLSYRPEPPAEEEGHAPLPILVQRASQLPAADEPTLEALSQRALALTTADDLLAGARATDPIDEPGWPASVRPPAADAHVVAAHEPIEEEPAPSRLERAVREAAAEQQLSPLLFEAAAELREHERRPLSEPPPPDLQSFLAASPMKVSDTARVAIPAPIRAPAIVYADPDPDEAPPAIEPPRVTDRYTDLDAAFRPRAPEPAPPKRDPDRGSWMLWAGVAAGAVLVLVGARLLRDDPAAPEPPRAPAAFAADTVDAPLPAHPSDRPSARPTATQPTADTSALAATPEPSFEPPDTSGLPVDRGLIWVDAHVVREVYVMGDVAGPTGKWLRVPCGLRNVRTAQPGPPPAGSSFPIWTSEGHSVLIPCRSYTRVTMPTDP